MSETAAVELLREVLADLLGRPVKAFSKDTGPLSACLKGGATSAAMTAFDLQQSIIAQYPTERRFLDFLLGKHILKYQSLFPTHIQLIRYAAASVADSSGGGRIVYSEDVIRFLVLQKRSAEAVTSGTLISSGSVAESEAQVAAAKLAQRLCWTLLTARCLLTPETQTPAADSAVAATDRRLSSESLCLLIETLSLLCLQTLRAILVSTRGPGADSEVHTDDALEPDKVLLPSKFGTSTSELWWSMAELVSEATSNGTLPLNGAMPLSTSGDLPDTTLLHWICIFHPVLFRSLNVLRLHLICQWIDLMESAYPRAAAKSSVPNSASYKFVPMTQLLANWNVLFPATEYTVPSDPSMSPESLSFPEDLEVFKAPLLARATEKLGLLWKPGLRPDDTPSIRCLIFDYSLILRVLDLALETALKEKPVREWFEAVEHGADVSQFTCFANSCPSTLDEDTDDVSDEKSHKETQTQLTEPRSSEETPTPSPRLRPFSQGRLRSRAVVFASLLLIRVFQSAMMYFRKYSDQPRLRLRLPRPAQLAALTTACLRLYAALHLSVQSWHVSQDLRAGCLADAFLLASLRCLRLMQVILQSRARDMTTSPGGTSTEDRRRSPVSSAKPVSQTDVSISDSVPLPEISQQMWQAIASLLERSTREQGEAPSPKWRNVSGEAREEIRLWEQSVRAASPSPSVSGLSNVSQASSSLGQQVFKGMPKRPQITGRWIRRQSQRRLQRSPPGKRVPSKQSTAHQTNEWLLCILLGAAMSCILLILTLYRSQSITQQRNEHIKSSIPKSNNFPLHPPTESFWAWPPV
eukprot:Gregarina_sp_Poly_1__5262@NODE_278_length_10191_cov_434_260174_g242_i0_p1_GENE_NODE_278_length_10191_cov_434_260174_g242_i0NODE_278_length_10191_cov_434_260174_g242_i0_p1_ORF_typecomplete_len809_score138_98CrgA/PF06781_12/9_3e03CrgA/PF06781_12/1e04CrgA/PF06781_12/0_85_NODE_278_length_10191_cov_434_260174_g242_i028115237